MSRGRKGGFRLRRSLEAPSLGPGSSRGRIGEDHAIADAYIAVGSNVGDRWRHLALARRRLGGRPSPVYESAPVGGPPQRCYLNGVLEVQWYATPDALLDLCHEVEEEAQRERTVRWGPRTLDLDIVAVGAVVMTSHRLELPHPRALDRAFVVLPMLALGTTGTTLTTDGLLRAARRTRDQRCRLVGPWPL